MVKFLINILIVSVPFVFIFQINPLDFFGVIKDIFSSQPVWKILFGTGVAVSLYLIFKRVEIDAINRWGAENSLDIQVVRKCDLLDAPITWRNLWSIVYYVEVMDKEGCQKSAWLNLGYRSWKVLEIDWQ